jgi:L-aminopeptidase/D-esterase-like protein
MKALLRLARCGIVIAALAASFVARADQDGLAADTSVSDPVLQFDWPNIEIGVGAYQQGPTGLTIIRFRSGAAVVADSRGGAPGTVNTDALRLGYAAPKVDAIVFSGGSAYGEEAIASVMTGLKDDGARSGASNNVGFAAGAIIYDFGGRRLNEIYPDKRLARAALHALHPGAFPLGAQGAGRMAMQGGFFGCGAHSGQGAAFRQFGGIKIAAFVVVNASGSIVDRAGQIVSCHPAATWVATPTIADLMTHLPASREASWEASRPDAPMTGNTTVSLIVTNAKLGYAGLQRLAIQAHTSMARGIQPFSTYDDGDTLFAASTEEVPSGSLSLLDLDALAGEIMWDAILASVPQQQPFAPPANVVVSPDRQRAYIGLYQFGPTARLKVTFEGGALHGTALGEDVFEFKADEATRLLAASDTEFYVDGRYRTRLSFIVGDDGRPTGATLNPGPWGQAGQRVGD